MSTVPIKIIDTIWFEWKKTVKFIQKLIIKKIVAFQVKFILIVLKCNLNISKKLKFQKQISSTEDNTVSVVSIIVPSILSIKFTDDYFCLSP